MGREIKTGESETAVEEQVEPKLKPPRMFKVFLLNDDYTPMDFVIEILQRFFDMDRQKAAKTMLEVHHAGRGVCGTFTYDVAETKVAQVNEFARNHEYPLLCGMEAA